MTPFLSRRIDCHSVITPPCQQAIVGNTHNGIYFIIAKWAALMGCPTAVNIQQYCIMPLFTIIV